jgi:predicted transcriptional regulator
MATRQTSIDCFNQIKANGLLSKQRFEVYLALLNLGKPSTTREVYATMNVDKQEATRFTELRNLGVIYEKSTRKCNITGKTAIEWDLTDKLPLKEKAPVVTKKQKIEAILNDVTNFAKTLSSEEEKEVLRGIYKKIKSL